MQKFYDFLFYFFYKFYARKEKGAASTAAGLIGVLQAFNVLALYMFFLIFWPQKNNFKIVGLSVAIFFQITTYIQYTYKENHSIQKIEERWLQKDEKEKIRIRVLSTIYVFLSFSVTLGLAIYLGSRRG